MKNKVVVFFPDSVRILINPSESLLAGHKCVVDPDLSKVEGLSPHQWELVNGTIVPASDAVAARQIPVWVPPAEPELVLNSSSMAPPTLFSELPASTRPASFVEVTQKSTAAEATPRPITQEGVQEVVTASALFTGYSFLSVLLLVGTTVVVGLCVYFAKKWGL